MNFKLAIMAAAVVGAASTAQAADLAKKAPAAANYVKVCDAFGEGFFYIPGSETCLKIGGFVYAQIGAYSVKNNYGNIGAMGYGSGRDRNAISTGARINISFDARTNTEMGLLRSYIEIQQTNGSQPYANAVNGNGVVDLEKGFIQFAGLTAGRATSMFDFFTGEHLSSILETAHSDSNINLFAYTFSFGNGITATLSAEDQRTGSTGRNWGGPYSATKMPDIVANVNITQAWGSAQIMGALHQNYSSLLVAGGANDDKLGYAIGAGAKIYLPLLGAGGANDDKLGYAIGAGAKINLPMLGASDEFAIQAAYSKGAISYVSPDWYAGQDFFTNGVSVSQTTAWAVAAGLTHGFTKTVSGNITASYAKYDAPTGFAADYNQFDIGANVTWAPVAGLAIIPEVEYKKVDFKGAGDTDALVGFVRVKRSF